MLRPFPMPYSIVIFLLPLTSACTMTMSDVTPSARTAVEARFPDATVQEVEAKFGDLYEIELKQDAAPVEIKLHKDGTILEIETVITRDDLPEAVAATVADEAKDHPLTEIEKVERLATQKLGGIEKLDETQVYYEVAWKVRGFEREIKVNPDGTIR